MNFPILATINEEKEKSEKTYFDTLISHGKYRVLFVVCLNILLRRHH